MGPVQLQSQGGGTLSDFALGLSVEHSLCTLSVDGYNDVARPEIGCLSLAPLCYLGHDDGRVKISASADAEAPGCWPHHIHSQCHAWDREEPGGGIHSHNTPQKKREKMVTALRLTQ